MAGERPKKQRRVGRPSSGLRSGESVKDYPQVSTRLPPDAKAKLRALSVIRSTPMWRVLVDAVDCYLRECPLSEQRLVEEHLRRSPSRRGHL
jgi:hypothetical protein